MSTRKRTQTAGALALAVIGMLIASGCDLAAQLTEAKGGDKDGGQEAKVQRYTEDGRPLVDLTVNYNRANVGDAETAGDPDNALFLGLAKTFNFVEVVFYDQTNYYAANARLPNPLKISIPAGTYEPPSGSNADGKAILLAGSYNNGQPILLAVGSIDISTQAVSPGISEILFVLEQLEMDIGVSLISSGSPPHLTPGRANIDEKTTPYYGVESQLAAFTSDDNILILHNSSSVEYGLIVPHTGSGAPKGRIEFVGYTTASPMIIGATALTAGTGQDITPNKVSMTGANIGIELSDVTGLNTAALGLALMTYRVPVMGLDATYGASSIPTDNKNAMVWYLQNGIQNAEIDRGATDGSTGIINSLGGGILLEFGGSLTQYTVTPGGP